MVLHNEAVWNAELHYLQSLCVDLSVCQLRCLIIQFRFVPLSLPSSSSSSFHFSVQLFLLLLVTQFSVSHSGETTSPWREQQQSSTLMLLVPLTLLPFACISLLLMITTASNYVTCDSVAVDANAFACPDPGCEFVATIPAETAVFINCTTSGVDVDDDYQWDYVGLQSDNTLIGYVSDLYVDCGGGACIAPSC